MDDAAGLNQTRTPSEQRSRAFRRFPASVGRFDDIAGRRKIDELVKWVEEHYREDLGKRPSKHVYVSKLPAHIIQRIDLLRNSSAICGAIRQHCGADCVITPMQHTDELYISHYNKDYGGDHGLFSRHYDGNLRFLPLGTVVRALIYLQSDPTYKVVFGDSMIEQSFVSYEFGLLDFHRELHWVEGEYNPADRQRILLKCNYMVAPRNSGLLAAAALALNTGIFYVVKAAMEYSKSPKNPPQFIVGLLCNLFRLLNNIHPLVPIAFILVILCAAGSGVLL